MYKMKMVSLVLLPLTIVLSGCLSKIEPDYEAKRELYKKAMLNGEVLGSDGKAFTVRYEGNIYTCFNLTGLCIVR